MIGMSSYPSTILLMVLANDFTICHHHVVICFLVHKMKGLDKIILTFNSNINLFSWSNVDFI